MYLTEYMKAVPTDRKRRINIHSTHCFGSGTTEEGEAEIRPQIMQIRISWRMISRWEDSLQHSVNKKVL